MPEPFLGGRCEDRFPLVSQRASRAISWSPFRRLVPPSPRSDLLPQIKRIIASYPDAPAGLEDYTWFSVPRTWEHLTVPTGDRREVIIEPRHQDQHAGVGFRVGWNEAEEVAALWML